MKFIIILLTLFTMVCFGADKISDLTDLASVESADDVAIVDDSASSTKRIGLDVLRPYFNAMFDTNSSNTCTMTWNEDDSSDRVLNVLVNAGDRTLDLKNNVRSPLIF